MSARPFHIALPALLVAAGAAVAPVGVTRAASREILPVAHVQARVIVARTMHAAVPTPREIPLRVRNPTAYLRAKRAAAGAGPRPSPGAAAPAAPSSAQTAVFGTLSAPGVSAAQQISAFGEGADLTPPDTTGAIGPADYVEIVNGEIAVYNRTNLTPVTAPVSVEDFTGGSSPCDVQVKYDPGSDRWFFLALRCDGTTAENQLYVGWSKTSDPANLTTGWCTFAVASAPATSLDDYPKLGLDGTHVIIGDNNYDASSMVFQTAHVLIAPKPRSGTMGSCSAPSFTVFGSAIAPLTTARGNLAFTPEPATISDTSSTVGYLVAADFDDATNDQSGSGLAVWQVGGSPGAPTLAAPVEMAVSSFAVPPSIPQPGTTDTIDSLDGRLTQAVAAADPSASGAEAVWTQHTVSDGASGSVVRWYELLPSTMVVRQSGTISDSDGFAFNGAIAPTTGGDAVIDYNAAGSSQQVQIKSQSRAAGDALGSMSSPITLATSSAVDSDFSCPSQPFGASNGIGVCRWGDYAGVSVDPDNPDVVWGSSQVNGQTGAFISRFGDQAQWATENFALTSTATPAPTASFTVSPNPVSPGSDVTFDAGASSDPAGIIGYTWSFGDGTTDPGAGAVDHHAYPSSGVYTVTLTLTDMGGRMSTTSHTVTVDVPPTASFTASPNPGAPGAPVDFDASASSDPNPAGAITSYSWNFGDQSGAIGLVAAHSYRTPGSYIATLTVTDAHGRTATETQTVIVDQPSASFTAAPNPAIPGAPVGFNATASSDAAGTIGAYSWSFGDGAGASGAAPSHTFDAPGSYLVTLTVTNNHGQTATAVNVVTVDAPPTAAFTIAPNPVMVGVSVTFDASSSTRPPNLSAGYVWTFGDGGTAGGPVVNHAYAKPGSYGVTLLVFDSDGQSTTAVEHVTVTAPRLQGQLTILGGQGVGSIRRHGLMVSLSSTQSGKATFSIAARINKTEPSGKPKRVTLLRGRTLTVASGRRRLTLNLSAVASRAMVRGHVAGLVVQVTVLDIFGQRLTLSASLRL